MLNSSLKQGTRLRRRCMSCLLENFNFGILTSNQCRIWCLSQKWLWFLGLGLLEGVGSIYKSINYIFAHLRPAHSGSLVYRPASSGPSWAAPAQGQKGRKWNPESNAIFHSIRSFISGPSALVLVQPKKDRPKLGVTLLTHCQRTGCAGLTKIPGDKTSKCRPGQCSQWAGHRRATMQKK